MLLDLIWGEPTMNLIIDHRYIYILYVKRKSKSTSQIEIKIEVLLAYMVLLNI